MSMGMSSHKDRAAADCAVMISISGPAKGCDANVCHERHYYQGALWRHDGSGRGLSDYIRSASFVAFYAADVITVAGHGMRHTRPGHRDLSWYSPNVRLMLSNVLGAIHPAYKYLSQAHSTSDICQRDV